MSMFKIVPESYNNPDDVYRTLNYILTPGKCLYSGVQYLLPTNHPLALSNLFHYTKQYYGKSNYKQVEHFILSIDSNCEEADITMSHLIKCAEYILQFNLAEYQTVYAVHRNSAGLHVHFILNTVNLFSGEMFRLNKSNFYSFMYAIAETLSMHHVALEGYTYYDERGRLRKGKSPEGFLYMNKIPQYI